MKDKLLLLDGDQFLFRAAAAVEQEAKFNEVLDEVDWSEPPVHVLFSHPGRAREVFDQMIERIFERFETRNHFMCFSSPPNFRFTIDKSYKNNRQNSRKPLCYVQLLEDVQNDTQFLCKSFPTLEADDVMGVLATMPMVVKKWDPIIVSADKDMKTIPTTIWNGEDLVTYTEEEADYWHMYQTLVGDTADGYKGCPGIGKVKAEKLLTTETDTGEQPLTNMWPRVVAAYEKAGLTEQDAITQARLARILRWEDWDNDNKKPILWTPNA